MGKPTTRLSLWLIVLCALAAALTALLLLIARGALSQADRSATDQTITLARTLSYAISGLVKEAPDNDGRLSSILDEVARDKEVRGVGIVGLDGKIVLQRGQAQLPPLPRISGKEQVFRRDAAFVVLSPFEIRQGCASGAGHKCGCGSAKACKCNHGHWTIPPGNYVLALAASPGGRKDAHIAVISASIASVILLAAFIVAALSLLRSIRTNTALVAEIALEQRRRIDLESQSLAAAGLAHEIRNPLGAISGYAQLLYEQLTGEQPRQRLSLMLRELSRVQDRLEEFMAFARKRALRLEPVQLDELIRECASLLQIDAERAGCTLSVSLNVQRSEIQGDRYQLKELVTNLILNAIQASSQGGAIALFLDETNGATVLAVCDSGVGIPEADLGRVFEPYFTTRAKGTGLGLSIARRIAEDHGAALTLENRVPQGVKATLVFPPPRV